MAVSGIRRLEGDKESEKSFFKCSIEAAITRWHEILTCYVTREGQFFLNDEKYYAKLPSLEGLPSITSPLALQKLFYHISIIKCFQHICVKVCWLVYHCCLAIVTIFMPKHMLWSLV